MAGFRPIGSFPIASSQAGVAGDNYFLGGPDDFVFEGGAAPEVSGINPIEVFQTIRETLRSAGSGATEVNTFSMVRETLRSSGVGATEVNVLSMIREVLRSTAEATSSGRRRMSFM